MNMEAAKKIGDMRKIGISTEAGTSTRRLTEGHCVRAQGAGACLLKRFTTAAMSFLFAARQGSTSVPEEAPIARKDTKGMEGSFTLLSRFDKATHNQMPSTGE